MKIRTHLFLFNCVSIVLLCGAALAEGLPREQRLLRVAVPLSLPELQLAHLRSLDLDFHTFDIKTGEAFLAATPGQLDQLRQLGYSPRVIEDLTPTPDSIEALNDYHDEVESDAAVTRIANDYPGIALRRDYPVTTLEGRAIGYLKISDNPAVDEPEPRLLLVSQHHAREVMTPELLIDFADYLTQNYGLDPEVTAWVDNYEIYIIPDHNPDGVHHVFNVYSNWRKNRRNNGDGTYGVDLNRNYPYAWGPAGCSGSSGSPGDDTYRGPSAGSERETQGITDLTLAVQPSISLTYHTYGEYVLHPFGCSPQLPDDPDRRTHRDTGSALAAAVVNDTADGFYRMGTPYELLYSVDGGSDDWLHAVAGTLAFTIEMNSSTQGFQPDYGTWRNTTVARNLEGLKFLVRRLAGPSIGGRVRDACSGLGIKAEVGIAEQNFTHGESPRTSLPGSGFFHRIVEPGEYTWYASASGFRRQDWPLTVDFRTASRDIHLVPSGSRGVEVRALAVEDAGGDADGRLDPGEEADLLLTALAGGEGVSGITAVLSTSDPYLQILQASASVPDLAAGAESPAADRFRVKVLPDAPDGYEAAVAVTFSANEALCRPVVPAKLLLTRGFPACPFLEESLDQNPGWTIEGPAGGWEFGIPQGSGGTGGPNAAKTGVNVYGTNLDGNYGTAQGEFRLTSGPWDLQGLRRAEIRFWRWLNNEPGYDPARIDASLDGLTWTEIWKGFGRDTRWEEYRIDLPEAFDNADQVWIRFVLVQDGGGAASGWYLDDIRLCGESALSAGGKVKFDSFRLIETDPLYGNADGELDTGETATLAVSVRSTRSVKTRWVSAVLTSGDPAVTIHNRAALYPDLDPGGVAESSAPHFSFTAGPDCGADIPFTLETRYENGLTTRSHFTVPVGSLAPATLFTDDMEIDRGWTISGSSNPGKWERGRPYGNSYQGQTTNPNADHTPDPGIACWNTQSVPPPATVSPFDAEVDNGSTVLTSPTLAASDFETLELVYWRWFYTGGGPGPDSFRAEVSNDGVTYRVVEEIGTRANLWAEVRRELSEYLAFTDNLRLRFTVTDSGGESIVEGGLDDLSLAGMRWSCQPFTPQASYRPNPVGNTLRVGRTNWDVGLTWTAPPPDATHGPALFYRVVRSERVDGGFDLLANPSSPQHFDAGAAGPSAAPLFTYLVTAENPAGPETP